MRSPMRGFDISRIGATPEESTSSALPRVTLRVALPSSPPSGAPPRELSHATFWRCLHTDCTTPTAAICTIMDDDP